MYFIGILSLRFSGMWRGLLHDVCSKFRMSLLVSPLRVGTPKKTNMLSRTFGQQLPAKRHHISGKKNETAFTLLGKDYKLTSQISVTPGIASIV